MERALTLRISGITEVNSEYRGGGLGRGNFGKVAEEFKDSPVRGEKRLYNPNTGMSANIHANTHTGTQTCKHTSPLTTKPCTQFTPGRWQSA